MLTKLLLSALILYCFWCYKIIFIGCGKCSACRAGIRETKVEEAARLYEERFSRKPSSISLLLLMTIYLFLIIFLGPLLVPYDAIKICLQDRKEAAKRRKHTDLTFFRTKPAELPSHVTGYCKKNTPVLERLGFQFDGIYWMKPHLNDYYAALFLDQAGTTYATLAHLNGDYWCGFGSIFVSGRCLETCTAEATPERMTKFVENPQFTVVYAPKETIQAKYHRHQNKLAEIIAATYDRPLVLEVDQICDALQYEGRVHSQQLYEFGDLDAPPPAPIPLLTPPNSPMTFGHIEPTF